MSRVSGFFIRNRHTGCIGGVEAHMRGSVLAAVSAIVACGLAAAGALGALADGGDCEPKATGVGVAELASSGQCNDTSSHGWGGPKGTQAMSISVNGAIRTYHLYVPMAASLDNPLPLCIFMHGAGGDYTQGLSIWQSYADSDGFILASPDSDAVTWTEIADYVQKGWQTFRDTVFMWAILNETARSYNVNYSRVWLTGFSDGASINMRIACKLPEVFSVACPHSGCWGPGFANPDWATRKMPQYWRVGDSDGFLNNDIAGQENFTKKGFECRMDVIPGWGHQWASDSCGKFLEFESVRHLPHNYIRPSVSFLSPASGASWAVAEEHKIQWWAGCGNGPYEIQLEYSTTGYSGPFTTIDTVQQAEYGPGEYNWTIPAGTLPTSNAVIRALISDSSNQTKTNVSMPLYTFSITAGAVPEPGPALVVPMVAGAAAAAVMAATRRRRCA